MSVIELRISNRKIEIIEFLRGFSIFAIVIMHLLQGFMGTLLNIIYTGTSFGGAGVHVFFSVRDWDCIFRIVKDSLVIWNLSKKMV